MPRSSSLRGRKSPKALRSRNSSKSSSAASRPRNRQARVAVSPTRASDVRDAARERQRISRAKKRSTTQSPPEVKHSAPMRSRSVPPLVHNTRDTELQSNVSPVHLGIQPVTENDVSKFVSALNAPIPVCFVCGRLQLLHKAPPLIRKFEPNSKYFSPIMDFPIEALTTPTHAHDTKKSNDTNDNKSNDIKIPRFYSQGIVKRTKEGSPEAVHVCRLCNRSLADGKLPKFSIMNGFYFGDIPSVIAELSTFEIRMISLVVPFISVYTSAGSVGQYVSQGNVINFKQDVSGIVKKLPRRLGGSGVIFAQQQSPDPKVTQIRPVRPNKIREALHWLKANHIAYYNIDIDEDFLQELEKREDKVSDVEFLNLRDQPVHMDTDIEIGDDEENSSKHHHNEFVESNQDLPRKRMKIDPSHTSNVKQEPDEEKKRKKYDEHNENVPSKRIKGNHGQVEDPTSQQIDNQQDQGKTLDTTDEWDISFVVGERILNTKDIDAMLEQTLPDDTVSPEETFVKIPAIPKEQMVNEYQETYVSLAFPHLYPLGLGDFKQTRIVRVTEKEYVQHLMLLADQRFETSPEWLFFWYNTVFRHQVNGATLTANKNNSDGAEDKISDEDLTLEDLIEVKRQRKFS